jgi:hypothetical protein
MYSLFNMTLNYGNITEGTLPSYRQDDLFQKEEVGTQEHRESEGGSSTEAGSCEEGKVKYKISKGVELAFNSWFEVISVITKGSCLLRCKCGVEKVLKFSFARRDVSCGCKRRQATPTLRHGMSKTSEHRTWCHIRQRCHNPSDAGYYKYGAKGVSVCDRWRYSFENFVEDMGLKPSPSHSIDRINVLGNYEPSNCRWATVDEQANNKRTSIKTVWKGIEMSLMEICKLENMNYPLANSRVYALGWSVEDAVLIPRNGSRNGRNSYKQIHAKGSIQ